MYEIEGKKRTKDAPILMLGAGRNLGLALAERLVLDGFSVILSYRNDPKGVVKLETSFPEQVKGGIPLDAKTPKAVERFFERVGEVTGKISAMVNCIGPFLQTPLLETSDEDFEMLVQSNLSQAFFSARRAMPLLRQNGEGRMIFFTFAGLEKIGAYGQLGAYAAVKLGVLSLVRSLAVEVAKEKITVNAIAPGIVTTADESQEKYLPHIPAGRMQTPADIYGGVRYLLSDEAKHVTGQNLTISGGFGWQYP